MFNYFIIKIEDLIKKKNPDDKKEIIGKKKSRSMSQSPKKEKLKSSKVLACNFGGVSLFLNDLNSRKVQILTKLTKKEGL